jgi:FkbM family methyltransferase
MAKKDWFKSFLVRLTSSNAAQRLLERNVVFLLELMGIGSGSSPSWSGEKGLGRLLRERYAGSKRPLCIFDVGASAGQFLSVVVQPLAAAGIPFRVHAFEPSPTAFQKLQASFRDRPDISLNNCGLGREPGQFDLFSNAPGSSLASLSRRRLDHFGIDFQASEKVTLIALDDYCRDRRVPSIDLLKLDVEGHELDVLQGGLRMFREHRIGMVSFEFGGADIDSKTFFQDFWYFFRDHADGTLHRITPSGRPMPIRAYAEIYEQFRNTNYLFVCNPPQA